MVNSTHTQRVVGLLEGQESKIIFGDMQEIDVNGRFIPPILVDEPSLESNLMKEEIFGPILPIITYIRPLDVIRHIQRGPSPLSIYYFGKRDSIIL